MVGQTENEVASEEIDWPKEIDRQLAAWEAFVWVRERRPQRDDRQEWLKRVVGTARSGF